LNIVRIIKNYLPESQCIELNRWVRSAIANNWIGKGITTTGDYRNSHRETAELRYTSRMYADRYQYPQLVRDLHAQIETEFNLTQWHDPVHEHGRDATVVSATQPGGDVYLHRDPTAYGKEVLRCNILTRATAGGRIWVGNQSYELEQGDMMQYLVSRHEHRVEKVKGNPGDLRIMWMFGWYVDGDIWENSIQ
jgi:hypothetical protein